MDYELCKKLKEVGFPQQIHQFTGLMFAEGDPTPIHCAGEHCYCPICTGEDVIAIPTLTELISACPEDGTQLVRGVGKIWYAEFIDHSMMPYKRTHLFQAHTPEEAVANLWLSLNQKQ